MSVSLTEVRKMYLKFFENKGHSIYPSHSLIPPKNDKTLLLVNAGMVPFKPYFTGDLIPNTSKIATCQRCIRTEDIENVGHTYRHLTFFEMLGNFSFGDYFKKQAIEWAYEFTLEYLKIPKDKLLITIYSGDTETFHIWLSLGIEKNKIIELKDNFWEIGVGPCGPCTEIYYDTGKCEKENCDLECECGRYLEFWNLVFTENYKNENGEFEELTKKNIDTGMGLERIASILNGTFDVFDIKEMKNIIEKICFYTDYKYGENKKNDIMVKIIADHMKSAVFLINDCVTPSFSGRGYVLRRLIRRANKNILMLKNDELILYKLVKTIVEEFREHFDTEIKQELIENIIKEEEEKFSITLEKGMEFLEEEISKIRKKYKNT